MIRACHRRREKKYYLWGDNVENMKHIYSCKLLKSDEPETEYENIYLNNIDKIVDVQKRFDENMKKRENLLKEYEDKEKLVSHAIQLRDPLYLVYSNG